MNMITNEINTCAIRVNNKICLRIHTYDIVQINIENERPQTTSL